MEACCGDKTICIPFESEEHYDACVQEPVLFRQALMGLYARYPELFPCRFNGGFTFHDRRFSERQQLVVRRIKLRATAQVFSIRPSLVLPYMTAMTDEVEKGLYLRHFGVPYEALAYVFDRPAMFWYRAEMALWANCPFE